MVSSPVDGFVSFFCRKHPHLVGRFLCLGSVVPKLSALHGDHLPRVPQGGGFSKISHFHRPYHAAGGADAAPRAFLESRSAVDIYPISHCQPVALQRVELWALHDVRTPSWCRTDFWRATCALRGILDFLRNPVSKFPHWALRRPAVCVTQCSCNHKLAPTGDPSDCICLLWRFWSVPFHLASRVPPDAPVIYTFLDTSRVVLTTHAAFLDRTIPTSAEPL